MSQTATAGAVESGEGIGRSTAVRPFRMTFEQYWAIVESGALDRSRVYLWNGELIEKMPPGRPHSCCLYLLKRALDQLAPAGYFVEQEQPMRLNAAYTPQPNLKVVRGSVTDFPELPPSASEVSLVVEVADTSLALDRGELLGAYAAAGVPTYWVVNLPDRLVESYSAPSGPSDLPGYGRVESFGSGEFVPVILDGREVGRIAVRDILVG